MDNRIREAFDALDRRTNHRLFCDHCNTEIPHAPTLTMDDLKPVIGGHFAEHHRERVYSWQVIREMPRLNMSVVG